MDASFEDGGERAISLTAQTTEDLAVVSALCQDALCKMARVQWLPRRRRIAFLLYRFRWEDAERAEREKRDYERVAAALTFDDVMAVRSIGIDRTDPEALFSLLRIDFAPGEDGAGVMTLDCAAGVSFEFDVECVNVALKDLTRPWAAGGKPEHSAT